MMCLYDSALAMHPMHFAIRIIKLAVLQWLAIQLGLRGVWPAIDGDDFDVEPEGESYLDRARRSVMRDCASLLSRL
jgi:hypothetical protein